jgi:hypothetical protein
VTGALSFTIRDAETHATPDFGQLGFIDAVALPGRKNEATLLGVKHNLQQFFGVYITEFIGCLLLAFIYNIAPTVDDVYSYWKYDNLPDSTNSIANAVSLLGGFGAALLYMFSFKHLSFQTQAILMTVIAAIGTLSAIPAFVLLGSSRAISVETYVIIDALIGGVTQDLYAFPIMVLASQCAVEGVEATTFALFGVFTSLGFMVSGWISVALMNLFHINNGVLLVSDLAWYTMICAISGVVIPLTAVVMVKTNPVEKLERVNASLAQFARYSNPI